MALGTVMLALGVHRLSFNHAPAMAWVDLIAGILLLVHAFPAMRPPAEARALAGRAPAWWEAWLAVGLAAGALGLWRANWPVAGFLSAAALVGLCVVRRLAPLRIEPGPADSGLARRAAFAAVMLVATFVRVWKFDGAPSGFHTDEMGFVGISYGFLEGRLDSPLGFLHTIHHHQPELLIAGLGSASIQLFGANLWGFRGVDFVMGIFASLAFLAVARSLAPLRIALPASLLWSWNHDGLYTSRFNMVHTTSMFLELGILYFAIRSCRSGGKLSPALAGLAAGLATYGYSGTRILVFLLPVVWLLMALPGPYPRPRLRAVALSCLVAVAVTLPGFAYSTRQVDWTFWRPAHSQETAWLSGADRGKVLQDVFRRVRDGARMICVEGNTNGTVQSRDGVTGVPLLEAAEGTLFLAGAACALASPATGIGLAALLCVAVGIPEATFGANLYYGPIQRRFALGTPALFVAVLFGLALVLGARYPGVALRRSAVAAVWVAVGVTMATNYVRIFVQWPRLPGARGYFYPPKGLHEGLRPLSAVPKGARVYVPIEVADAPISPMIAGINGLQMKRGLPPEGTATDGRETWLVWPVSAGAPPGAPDRPPERLFRDMDGLPAAGLWRVAKGPENR